MKVDYSSDFILKILLTVKPSTANQYDFENYILVLILGNDYELSKENFAL